jgi:putative hydrolase of the HAD superfamily
MEQKPIIKLVLFDFGGVLAEEGFLNGLRVIAQRNNLDEQAFLETVFETAYETGFVTGQTRDEGFWNRLKEKTGIRGENHDLTEEILSRFTLRPWMFGTISELKRNGIFVGILSDQCHWLDELDRRHSFFQHFDKVFNSFHVGLSKHDPAAFKHALSTMRVAPENALFVDDHLPHVERARAQGLHAIHFTDRKGFLKSMKKFFP